MSEPLRGERGAEGRAVREAVGIVERGDHGQIRLWGRDPVKMVQGLISNDLAGAPPGRGVYAAMLTPKGRTIAELRAFRREGGTEVLLDLPREAMEGTREHLRKFVPPMFARWADVTEETGMIGVYGPRSRELVERVLGEVPAGSEEDATAEAAFGEAPVLVARTRYAGGEDGYDLFAPRASLGELWRTLRERGEELGARPIGLEALETLRIEAGRPRYGTDITAETIPTEAWESSGLLSRGISFTKGCYTGQEVIIRIAHRGHVNRHLRGLLLGDAPAPPYRTPLLHPETGKEVGWITSTASSERLGQTIALGYVRRELGPGDRVRVGSASGAEARIVELPFPPAEPDAR